MKKCIYSFCTFCHWSWSWSKGCLTVKLCDKILLDPTKFEFWPWTWSRIVDHFTMTPDDNLINHGYSLLNGNLSMIIFALHQIFCQKKIVLKVIFNSKFILRILELNRVFTRF